MGRHDGRHFHGKVFARRSNRQLDHDLALVLENAWIESDCFSGKHVTNRIPPGKMNIPGRMVVARRFDKRFGIGVGVLLWVVVYAPTGPGASFSESPFFDYGFASVSVML